MDFSTNQHTLYISSNTDPDAGDVILVYRGDLDILPWTLPDKCFSRDSLTNIATIVGGIFGGLLFTALAVFLIYVGIRRYKRRSNKVEDENDHEHDDHAA